MEKRVTLTLDKPIDKLDIREDLLRENGYVKVVYCKNCPYLSKAILIDGEHGFCWFWKCLVNYKWFCFAPLETEKGE